VFGDWYRKKATSALHLLSQQWQITYEANAMEIAHTTRDLVPQEDRMSNPIATALLIDTTTNASALQKQHPEIYHITRAN
jgi:hypothetical protein